MTTKKKSKGEKEGLRRLTDDEMRSLVKDSVTGRVFFSDQAPPDFLPMVFMPVALGAFADWSEEEIKRIGALYGRVEDQMPRSINGYPIFQSFAIVQVDDWAKVRKMLAAAHKAINEVEVPK